MNFNVIINPRAANGNTLRRLPQIKRLLMQNPHIFNWNITETADEMRAIILNGSSQNVDCFLLIGGDGTIHEAIPSLRKANKPFGLIPCGRGNDFARNAGLPLDLQNNCIIPSFPRFKEIDIPAVNDVYFCSIACLGFDAVVNKLALEGKGHFGGTLGYIICVIKALRLFTPLEIEIEIDEIQWSGRIMMVAIANGPCYGGGMRIAPNAQLDSGAFEVCIVEEISKLELLRQFPKVFTGNHVTHEKVIMKSGKRIRISSPESRDVFADGEYVGKLPLECVIEPQKLKVMMPSLHSC